MEIIETVAVCRHIGRSGRERRSSDQANALPLRHSLRSYITPRLSAIARYVNQSVVAANPNQAALERRFHNRENGVVIFHARLVDGERSTRRHLLALVVARQVWTDRCPIHPAIGRFE